MSGFEYETPGNTVPSRDEFTDQDVLLGADENETPVIFTKKALAASIVPRTTYERLQTGDTILGYRDGKAALFTYKALIDAKPAGLAFTSVTATNGGGKATMAGHITDLQGSEIWYRVKVDDANYGDWEGPFASPYTFSKEVVPLTVGKRTMTVQAKSAFTVEPYPAYSKEVNVTDAGNADVSVDSMVASGGEEKATITAKIVDASGDQVYWRGKHDLAGYTAWQGPYPSPHNLSWAPTGMPGGTRVITIQAKSYDQPPYAEDSRTVTITEAPLLPGEFKLVDKNATHDRLTVFNKTIRYNIADYGAIKLIGKNPEGNWVFDAVRFLAPGAGWIKIPANIDSGQTPGPGYKWRVTMTGATAEEYPFSVSTVDTPAPPPDMTGYTLLKDWNFGTGGNVTNTAQLNADFNWGMHFGDQDPNHPKANPSEWQNYTATGSSNYVFNADSLSFKPINLVAPAAPGKNDITSGMIRTIEKFAPTATKSVYFESMISLPKGKGFWPAFWLIPRDGAGGTIAKGKSEIDIFEVPMSETETSADFEVTTLHNNIHSYAKYGYFSAHTQKAATIEGISPHISNKFMRFGLEATYTNLKFYVDNKLVRSIPFDWPDTGKGWGTAVEPSVVLGLAIGGSWPGPADRPSDYTGTAGEMKVDYLKVFTKG